MMTGMENKTDNRSIKAQTRFVVTREFCGTQTMQEAFEAEAAALCMAGVIAVSGSL